MRRVLLVGVGVVATLLVLVVAAVLVLTQSDWGHERVRRVALGQLQAHTHGIVRMGRIEGDLVSGLTVHDFSITDSTGAPFIATKSLSARYAVRTLIGKRLYFSHIRLDHPLIVLDKRPHEKWNYERIFPRGAASTDTTPGFGSWIAFTDVRISNGRVLIKAPWAPSDTLPPRGRDSVIAATLGGDSRLNVVAVPGGYQKIMDFRQLDASMPRLRLADPQIKTRLIEVASLRAAALPFRPPAAEIRDLAGSFELTGDSVWFANVRARLPNTTASGSGRYSFDSGDLRLRLNAPQAAFADVRFVYPRLPSEGSGSGELAMDWVGKTQKYLARGFDVRVREAHLAGDVGVTLADTLALHDTNVRFENLDTRLIEQIAPAAKSPRRGTLTGRMVAAGGTHALRLDGDVAFDDVRDGRSRVVAAGEVGFGPGFRARDLRLNLLPVQVNLARQVMPTLPVRGTVRGSAVIDGSTTTALVTRLDVVHEDRGAVSRLAGRSEVRLAGAKWFDIDLQARPLSLATVGRFAPAVGLRGAAAGPVRLTGTLDDLAVRTDMRLSDGGSLAIRGRLGLTGAQKRYDLSVGAKLFNAHSILTKAPETSVTATASGRGEGFDPATMRAALVADMETSSYDSIPFDSARVRVAIANGVAHVDTLTLRGPNAAADAEGTFGLVASRTGTLVYHLTVDTLGAFARLLPPADTGAIAPRPGRRARAIARAHLDSLRAAEATAVRSAATGVAANPPRIPIDTPTVVRRDSVSGSAYSAGMLRGNLRDFGVRGRAALADLVARGTTLRRAAAEYEMVHGGTEHPAFVVAAHADTLSSGGFAFDSANVRLTYRAPEGTAVVAISQETGRDYSAAADFVLRTDQNEIRFRNLALRFDTARWVASRPSSVRWGPHGIDVAAVELRNGARGRIYVNGRIPTEGNANLEVAINDLEIGNLVSLVQSDIEASGLVSLTADVRGTLRDPRMRGAVGVAGGVYRGTPLPELHATFDYANANLAARADAQRTGGASLARVDAAIPINLAAGATGPRLSERPLRIDFTADSLPLEVLPKFTDAVANVRGRAIGVVRVRGTARHPDMAGAIALDLGSFEVVSTGVTYRDLTGQIRLLRDTVVIDSIVAYSGGRVFLRGGLGIATIAKPSFDLHLVASNARVLDNNLGRLWADAGIAFTGPFDNVYVSGRAGIRHGVIFAPESDTKKVINASDPAVFNVVDTSVVANRELLPAQSPLLENLRMDVALNVARDTWVRRSDANVEIFTPPDAGDLAIHVDRRRQALTLEGIVSTERGEYQFLSKRFQVTRGSATFIGSPELNPTLQVTAENQVQLPSREAINIRVVIGGTLQTPRISLESDAQPPISQSDLLSYLAFGRSSSSLLQTEGSSLATSNSGGGLVGPAAALATTKLAGVAIGVVADQVESEVGRSLGADVFNVTPADVPTELGRSGVNSFITGTEIELGKYTDAKTFLAAQARADPRALPGLRIQRRTAKGYRLEASFEPRYVLSPPSLDNQDVARTSVFGLFLIREWRY